MSSTSVTFTFSRLSRSEPGHDGPLAIGVIGASTVLFVRVLAATATLNPQLARAAAPYFALPFLAGVAATAVSWRWTHKVAEKESPVRNPLQFWNSVQMAILFQVVLYLVHWLGGSFGNRGLLASGAILGFTDVDALTISMARGVQTTDWTVPAQALSIGILSNTVLKAIAALVLGTGRFRRHATAGLAGIGVAMVISFLILR